MSCSHTAGLHRALSYYKDRLANMAALTPTFWMSGKLTLQLYRGTPGSPSGYKASPPFCTITSAFRPSKAPVQVLENSKWQVRRPSRPRLLLNLSPDSPPEACITELACTSQSAHSQPQFAAARLHKCCASKGPCYFFEKRLASFTALMAGFLTPANSAFSLTFDSPSPPERCTTTCMFPHSRIPRQHI